VSAGLIEGWEPDAETATAILRYARDHLTSYKRVRRIEFGELPRTISGRIRRVGLRGAEQDRPTGDDPEDGDGTRAGREFWEEDLPGLRDPG
jgi:acetyl-CoA synthetase